MFPNSAHARFAAVIEVANVSEKPKRNPRLNRVDISDEAILYTAAADELHTLNSTARRIWELCDGQHTIDEMAAALRSQFAVPDDVDVRADVIETLARFAAKGLLGDG